MWDATELPPQDEVFEVGNEIKGTLFSEQLQNKMFTMWVNDLLVKDYANSHPQLKRFHKFARAHGAYKGEKV